MTTYSNQSETPNAPRALRFWYSYGYRSRQAAHDAIEEMYASGEISPCDAPLVVAYISGNGERRYGVQLNEY